MQIDVHHRCADGRVGALFDCTDLEPIRKKWELSVEYGGQNFQVLTGVRDFISVPTERLEQIKLEARA